MRVHSVLLAGVAVLLANSVFVLASPDKATESNTSSVENASKRRLLVPEEILDVGTLLPEVVERHHELREVFTKFCLEKNAAEVEQEQKEEEEIRGKHMDPALLAHLLKMKKQKSKTRMLEEIDCKKLKKIIGEK